MDQEACLKIHTHPAFLIFPHGKPLDSFVLKTRQKRSLISPKLAGANGDTDEGSLRHISQVAKTSRGTHAAVMHVLILSPASTLAWSNFVSLLPFISSKSVVSLNHYREKAETTHMFRAALPAPLRALRPAVFRRGKRYDWIERPGSQWTVPARSLAKVKGEAIDRTYLSVG
jgi:hypothetical protein